MSKERLLPQLAPGPRLTDAGTARNVRVGSIRAADGRLRESV